MLQEIKTAKMVAAIFASLLVSSVAVSAAVGPATPYIGDRMASTLRA